MTSVHLEGTLAETLPHLRPAEVIDNGVTNEADVDKVPEQTAKPDADKAGKKSKEATPTVPYFRLFRYP